jgi:hypothetical protein
MRGVGIEATPNVSIPPLYAPSQAVHEKVGRRIRRPNRLSLLLDPEEGAGEQGVVLRRTRLLRYGNSHTENSVPVTVKSAVLAAPMKTPYQP